MVWASLILCDCRCVVIPWTPIRLGSHLLFVVWLQKEMIMKRFNKTPDFSFTYTSGGEHIGHYTENGYIEGNINQLRNKGIGLLITKEVLNNIPYYLCPIIQNDKIGFINSFADIIIEPQYDSFIGDFTSPESLITVSNGRISKYITYRYSICYSHELKIRTRYNRDHDQKSHDSIW